MLHNVIIRGKRAGDTILWCLTGEDAGHTAASGSGVILTELPVQFGLSCSRRQVGVTQLPEQQGRRRRQLLLKHTQIRSFFLYLMTNKHKTVLTNATRDN